MNKTQTALLTVASLIPIGLLALLFTSPTILIIRWGIILFALLSGVVAFYLYQQNKQLNKQIAYQQQLSRDVQQLNGVQKFTAALNAAQNMDRLEAVALQTLTEDLGYSQAIMGLIDQEKEVMAGWWELATDRGEPQHHPATLPIRRNRALTKAWETQKLAYFSHDAQFQIDNGVVVPVMWGSEIIAMLICATVQNGEPVDRLEQIAQLTAVRLGTMMTRSRRARESTIQEERARIAIDLHDTVSQSLFGIVLTLDACLKLLPEKPELAIPELQKSLDTADAVRQEIRQSIHDLWPRNFTANRFEQDLRRYMIDTLQAVELTMTLDIKGSFNAMSPAVRRSLYRICQESLNNIVHHAGATEAKVCLDIVQQRIQLAVRDNGRGFNPNQILNRVRDREQFGIRGMQERILSLGGSCDVFSQPNAGTSLIIDLPLSPANV